MYSSNNKIDYDDINIDINFHDKKIFALLNADMKILQKYYDSNHILGIYYDEAEEQIYAIVMPTFEHLCACKGLIEQDIHDGGKVFHIRDIRLALSASKNGHPEFLKSLTGKYVLINPRYSHIYDKAFNENYEKFKQTAYDDEPCLELKKGVQDVLRVCLLTNSAIIPFLKQLTDLEKTGLERLIENIGEEGIFSQSKLASDVGMSRLGVTNLIQKLENFNMAEIQRLGRGGTYCRIKDPVLIDVKGILGNSQNKQ